MAAPGRREGELCAGRRWSWRGWGEGSVVTRLRGQLSDVHGPAMRPRVLFRGRVGAGTPARTPNLQKLATLPTTREGRDACCPPLRSQRSPAEMPAAWTRFTDGVSVARGHCPAIADG